MIPLPLIKKTKMQNLLVGVLVLGYFFHSMTYLCSIMDTAIVLFLSV